MNINKKLLTILYSTIISTSICIATLTNLDNGQVFGLGASLLILTWITLDNENFKSKF